LLTLLAMHCGKVLTQRFLIGEIWGAAVADEAQSLRVFLFAVLDGGSEKQNLPAVRAAGLRDDTDERTLARTIRPGKRHGFTLRNGKTNAGKRLRILVSLADFTGLQKQWCVHAARP
jgi:hypothetical protein